MKEDVLFDVGEPKPLPPPPVPPPDPPKVEELDRTLSMVFSPPLAGATFSDCGTWRYVLWRIFSFDPKKKKILWIVHNPSVADEADDDRSVTRMISFSLREGARSMAVVNKDAFVATDPADMRRAAKKGIDICGPDNMKHIAEQIELADVVICGWGAGGEYGDSGRKFYAELRKIYDGPLYCLGVTKHGHPRHMLYLRSDTPLVPFEYKDVLPKDEEF